MNEEQKELKVCEMEVLEDLVLAQDIIPKGDKITALKLDSCYKVFHRTGWWLVDKSFFEEFKNRRSP